MEQAGFFTSGAQFYGSERNRVRKFAILSFTLALSVLLGVGLLWRWGQWLPLPAVLAVGFALWALPMFWYASRRNYRRLQSLYEQAGPAEERNALLILCYSTMSQAMTAIALIAGFLFLALASLASSIARH
jgi:hypothetical protein